MVIIFFRVLIVYAILLVYLRLMGKRQLGELQPFELVITLLIADIATLPMTQVSMPILFSVVPLTTLVIVEIVVSLLSRKSVFLRKVLNGKPMIVISSNGIEYSALKEMNMSIDDLMEGLRGCGYFCIDDVLYAIVETNGTITAIPHKDKANVTNEDLGLKKEETKLPILIVTSGKVINSNLKRARIDVDFVKNILKKVGLDDIKKVMILSLDSGGSVYIETFDNQKKNLQIDYKGEW